MKAKRASIYSELVFFVIIAFIVILITLPMLSKPKKSNNIEQNPQNYNNVQDYNTQQNNNIQQNTQNNSYDNNSYNNGYNNNSQPYNDNNQYNNNNINNSYNNSYNGPPRNVNNTIDNSIQGNNSNRVYPSLQKVNKKDSKILNFLDGIMYNINKSMASFHIFPKTYIGPTALKNNSFAPIIRFDTIKKEDVASPSSSVQTSSKIEEPVSNLLPPP